MAKASIGLGTKTFSLLLASLVLSGCYKIEIKETLNLDGTSKIDMQIDMSAVMGAMTGIAEGFAESLNEAFDAESMVGQTFESCADPELLEQYQVETLEEEQNNTRTLEIVKTVSCEIGEAEGTINIVESHSDDLDNPSIIERKADSCDDPAILAFYQVASFKTPITETYSVKENVTTNCSETDVDVTVNTTTIRLPDGDPAYQTLVFNKPLVTESTNTLATESPADDLQANTETDFDFCAESDHNPEKMPFFFEECTTIAPGVGAFSFAKYDTTSFTVNSNNTVTYQLEASTEAVTQEVSDSQAKNDASDNRQMELMGFVVDYVLVSPWPILEHSVGTLEDEYTLRINLLEADAQTMTVTLDTDGSTLALLAPKTQSQIDALITSLKTKLMASDAPVEKQVEYIFHLSNKIQKLAAIRPDQQVPLGYLQTKLIGLGEDLENATFEALDQEFLNELDSITEEALEATEDEEALADNAVTTESDQPENVNSQDLDDTVGETEQTFEDNAEKIETEDSVEIDETTPEQLEGEFDALTEQMEATNPTEDAASDNSIILE